MTQICIITVDVIDQSFFFLNDNPKLLVYVPDLLLWIVILIEYIYGEKGLNKSLIENSAITLGRLAWVCPELVSPHMEHFMQAWCFALSM